MWRLEKLSKIVKTEDYLEKKLYMQISYNKFIDVEREGNEPVKV